MLCTKAFRPDWPENYKCTKKKIALIRKNNKNMHLYALTNKYAKICIVKFSICTINKTKHILAELIFLYGIAKKKKMQNTRE